MNISDECDREAAAGQALRPMTGSARPPAPRTSFSPGLRPASGTQVRDELTACLALVAPAGMSQESRGEWLASAWATLGHLPADLLALGCRKARETCDHHARIVPVVIAETRYALERRREAEREAGRPAIPRAHSRPRQPVLTPRRPSAASRPSGTIEAMTVPGRVDAASLLLSLDPPPWFVRHARAVAEVAGWLAARIEERGIAIDRRLVEAAALLHDVDKALPADDPARGLPHGDGSAAWLTGVGHPELARAVASHPVTPPARRRAVSALGGVRDPRGTDRRLRGQAGRPAPRDDGRPVRLVASPVSAARRRRPRRRLGGCRLHAVRARADRLEGDVCRAAGISAGRGPPAGLDRPGTPRARAATHRARPDRSMTTVPLAFFWGDDELSAARAVDRFEAALAAETGGADGPLAPARQPEQATGLIGELHGRVATPVMFGGGTLAIVMNPGALVGQGRGPRRVPRRDRPRRARATRS